LTDEARALELYRRAVSLVEAQGRLATVGLLTYREFRGNGLSVRYFPSSGTLEVWHNDKVLVVHRREGKPRMVRYVTGGWEGLLNEAANEQRT
jgi:hypothetical protein